MRTLHGQDYCPSPTPTSFCNVVGPSPILLSSCQGKNLCFWRKLIRHFSNQMNPISVYKTVLNFQKGKIKLMPKYNSSHHALPLDQQMANDCTALHWLTSSSLGLAVVIVCYTFQTPVLPSQLPASWKIDVSPLSFLSADSTICHVVASISWPQCSLCVLAMILRTAGQVLHNQQDFWLIIIEYQAPMPRGKSLLKVTGMKKEAS